MRETWWSRYVNVAMGSYALDGSFFFFFFFFLLMFLPYCTANHHVRVSLLGALYQGLEVSWIDFLPGGARSNL